MANRLTQSSSTSTSSSSASTQSQSQSQSATQKVLDTGLLQTILAGLAGGMTDEEIEQYAQKLLLPQKNAQAEASRQQYETTRLSKEQEIEELAAELERSWSGASPRRTAPTGRAPHRWRRRRSSAAWAARATQCRRWPTRERCWHRPSGS